MSKLNERTKSHRNWTDFFREYLYEVNQKMMSSYEIKTKDKKQEYANCHKRAYRKLKLPFEEMQEDVQPPDFPSVDLTFNVKHAIQGQNELDVLIPSKVNYQQIEADAIQLLKWAKGRSQADEQQIWLYLKQKYLCPLDVLDRLQIHFQFLRFGLQNIQPYITIHCQNIKARAFMEAVLSTGRYFSSDKKTKADKQNKQPNTLKHWCSQCKVYCCVRHQPMKYIKKNTSKPYKKDRLISIYLSQFTLRDQLSKLLNFQRIRLKGPQCSLGCYKSLKRDSFLTRFNNFKLPEDSQLCQLYERAKQIYGHQPCKISKATNQVCSDVAVYLMATTSVRADHFSGETSEAAYLRNVKKQKYKTVDKIRGCKCIQGDCRTSKCFCFANNSECDPSCCYNCFEDQDFLRTCENQQIISEDLPHLKLGRSETNKQAFGLYTLQNIDLNKIVFCVRGQIIHPKQRIQVLSSRVLLQNIDPNISYRNFSGKERFIRQGQGDANVKLERRRVAGQECTVGVANRNIAVHQELLI